MVVKDGKRKRTHEYLISGIICGVKKTRGNLSKMWHLFSKKRVTMMEKREQKEQKLTFKELVNFELSQQSDMI